MDGKLPGSCATGKDALHSLFDESLPNRFLVDGRNIFASSTEMFEIGDFAQPKRSRLPNFLVGHAAFSSHIPSPGPIFDEFAAAACRFQPAEVIWRANVSVYNPTLETTGL